jgi:hypothetical protein
MGQYLIKEGPRPSAPALQPPMEMSFPVCVNHLPPHIASLPTFRMPGIRHNQRAKKMKQKKKGPSCVVRCAKVTGRFCKRRRRKFYFIFCDFSGSEFRFIKMAHEARSVARSQTKVWEPHIANLFCLKIYTN